MKKNIKPEKNRYRILACAYSLAAEAVLEKFGGRDYQFIDGIIEPEFSGMIPPVSHPLFYLISHSLELYMKGYLLSKGMTEEKLRKKLGHRMADLMRKCIEKGFEFESNEKMCIDVLGSLNQDGYPLRYPKKFNGGAALSFQEIFALVKKLDDALSDLGK